MLVEGGVEKMKTRSEIVNGMCMTYDHSYGFRVTELEKVRFPTTCGYTQKEAEGLYRIMDQIFEHDVKPILEEAGIKF